MFIAAQRLLHKHGRLFFAIIGVMIVLPFVFWGTAGVKRETGYSSGVLPSVPPRNAQELSEQRQNLRE
jgi:hypothetical protein